MEQTGRGTNSSIPSIPSIAGFVRPSGDVNFVSRNGGSASAPTRKPAHQDSPAATATRSARLVRRQDLCVKTG